MPQLLRLNGCRWPGQSLSAFRGPSRPALTFKSRSRDRLRSRATRIHAREQNGGHVLCVHVYDRLHTDTHIRDTAPPDKPVARTSDRITYSVRKLDYLDFPGARVRTTPCSFGKIAIVQRAMKGIRRLPAGIAQSPIVVTSGPKKKTKVIFLCSTL